MLPFSKRPPPPEEYFLRSGDFESVQPQQLPHASHAAQSHHTPVSTPVSVMPAPAPSVFARHAAPTPYGFTHNQPPAYGYGDLSAPPPPHSLAPVAMISERTGQAPVSTARRMSSLSLGEKPSLTWGVMIALTGALLGGVLGLGMDAKRQRDHAAASAGLPEPAAAAATSVPATPAAPAAPPSASLLAGNGAVVAPAPAPQPVAARAPVVLAPPSPPAPPAPVFVTPPKADPPAKADKHAKAPAAPAKHPSFVAAKVSAPKPPPAEKADKAERPEPAPKPVAKPEKAPKTEKAGSSDARKVLEDAIKDTTNTL